MAKSQKALNFDHKEVAVIFSLFIFVSLLMFTVGILVGKGLQKEAGGNHNASLSQMNSHIPILPQQGEGHIEPHKQSAHSKAVALEDDESPAHGAHHDSPPRTPAQQKDPHQEANPRVEHVNSLKLLPKADSEPDIYSGSLREPSREPLAPEDAVLKNPEVASLLAPSNREPSNAPVPYSYPEGKFTVQVGSFPNKEDAEQRVQDLQKLGFQHAYFSANKVGKKEDTWYRVWLGYYPSYKLADQNALYLRKKGELRNYLVRKAKNTNG